MRWWGTNTGVARKNSLPAAQSESSAGAGRVLAIRRVEVAAPFATSSFIYRTSELSYERDPYAEFLVPPAESLAPAIREYLRASGAFSSVVDPGSAQQPNTFLEVYVNQLYGDFRQPTATAAVIEARLTWLEAMNGMAGNVLLQKDYSRHLPLQHRTAAAVMAGWNAGLKAIMQQAASDFAKRQ